MLGLLHSTSAHRLKELTITNPRNARSSLMVAKMQVISGHRPGERHTCPAAEAEAVGALPAESPAWAPLGVEAALLPPPQVSPGAWS